MEVDDKRRHVLTKYSSKKGHRVVVESDHNILFASFNITYKKSTLIVKREVFNFKDKTSQSKFHDLTENTTAFSSCFTRS